MKTASIKNPTLNWTKTNTILLLHAGTDHPAVPKQKQRGWHTDSDRNSPQKHKRTPQDTDKQTGGQRQGTPTVSVTGTPRAGLSQHKRSWINWSRSPPSRRPSDKARRPPCTSPPPPTSAKGGRRGWGVGQSFQPFFLSPSLEIKYPSVPFMYSKYQIFLFYLYPTFKSWYLSPCIISLISLLSLPLNNNNNKITSYIPHILRFISFNSIPPP